MSHGGVRRISSAILPVVVMVVYLWHLVRTGLPGEILFESADSAGDMLQVRRGLEKGWFVTGHHSDVGVHHPGPFALWVKVAAELLGSFGVGGSTYALSMTLFLGLRLAALATVGWAFSRMASSRAVGWSAVLGVVTMLHLEGTVTGLDLQGSTIHFLSAWAVLLMLTGAALTTTGRGSAHLLILGSGISAHVHTPSFPVGVVGLALTAVLLLRERSSRRHKATAWALWLVFSAPLAVRVFLEPGFPLNYVDAARQRRALSGTGTGRSSLDGLVGVLDLPKPLLLALLALPVVLAVLARRRSGPAALALASTTVWSAVVLAVSPSQERVATELVWMAGIVLFSAALLTAAAGFIVKRGFSVVVSKTRRLQAWVSTASVTFTVVLLAITTLLLGTSLPTSVSRNGGGDGRHVPLLVDAMTRTGEPFVLVLAEPNWFTTSSGVLLELERRGADFCVAANSAFADDLDTFLATDRRCVAGERDRPSFTVVWDAVRGLAEMPSGSKLVVEGTEQVLPVEEYGLWICSQRPFGGTCSLPLPDDAVEVAVSREPDEGAYGMVSALRLIAFSCTPHPAIACTEFGNDTR